MPFIKNSCIEEIKARVNIYDLVSAYVSLKKSGSSYKGLSPFSHEKTPSFFVHPDKNYFYCFSSGQGGDIFKFIQLKEGLNFGESAEFIAARFGIPVEYERGAGAPAQNSSLRKQLFDINELAASWYVKNFWAENETAEKIRKYWVDERKFTLDDAKNLGIGFAPVSDAPMKNGLVKKGFSMEAIKKCGLFFARESDRDIHSLMPRFRGRLMISIADTQGRIIGFTARKTEFTPADIAYEEGKYVNSPETDIFKKNAVLFNLDKARKAIVTLGYAIVVEGQIDTMRMYCSGFENTVASQGTSLGEEHLAILKRHTDTVALLFDGDDAGANAALSKIPLCIKAGLAPLVIRLPKGDDPDSFIRKFGAEKMREKLQKERINPIKFSVDALSKGELAQMSPLQKSSLAETVFDTINACPSAVATEAYLEELARATLSDPRALKADFALWRRKNRRFSNAQQDAPTASKNIVSPSRKMLTNACYDALVVCLNYENVAEALAQVVEDEWLDKNDLDEDALRRVLVLYREGIGFDISEIDAHFESGEIKKRICKAYNEDKSLFANPVDTANECAKKIYSKYCLKSLDTLTKSLDDESLNAETKKEIIAKIKRLRTKSRIPPKVITS